MTLELLRDKLKHSHPELFGHFREDAHGKKAGGKLGDWLNHVATELADIDQMDIFTDEFDCKPSDYLHDVLDEHLETFGPLNEDRDIEQIEAYSRLQGLKVELEIYERKGIIE